MNESEDELEVALTADVLFAFDRSSLRPAAASRIRETANRIGEAKPARVRVVGGYTDSKGSAAYNQRLSERLAAASRIRPLRTRRKTAATTLALAIVVGRSPSPR